MDDFDQFNHADSDIYAYHLDADQAGAIVRNRCRNIEHLQHTIERLPLGYDLYLDCTGLRQDFVLDKSSIVNPAHQVDRAVVLGWELPPDRPRGQTWTIARPYGWQFEIDLTNRLGSGYVYSSRYLSEAQAIEDFYEFNRHRVPYAHSQLKTIKWSPGYLKNPWTDHVLAMGLAAGFIDPLESNALSMTQYSITLLASCLKKFKNSEEGRRAYNRSMRLAWRTISKYLLHTYMLSKPRDTDFWKYYDRLDGRKSLWENYRIHSETWTNIYPRAMWLCWGPTIESSLIFLIDSLSVSRNSPPTSLSD